jgi:predicted RNase H-like nuclease (RuvC/YqgF family)
MSCTNHSYDSRINDLTEELYDRECEIETLEVENRMMRARMDRLQEENTMLIKQVDALLLMVKSNEADRLKVINEVWQNTMEKRG